MTLKRERAGRSVEWNPDANGAAWFVERVFYVGGAREELEALGTIDNKVEAVVSERFREMTEGVASSGGAGRIADETTREDAVEEGGTGQDAVADVGAVSDKGAGVELVEYRPNYLKYETLSNRERVAVFSEIYYDKGWKAYVDGVETPYFRADYILRGMVVPAGAHTIEWRFRAPRFAAVEGVTLGCSIAILLWLAAAVSLDLKKRKVFNNL